MEKYVSHYSATSYWNIPYIDTVLGSVFNNSKTVDITVHKQDASLNIRDVKIHLSKLPLPAGSVKLIDGVRVASPELLFLQLGCKLDIHRQILLGLQLCSHPPGDSKTAITTRRKLKNFITKTSGHCGHRNAVRAISYIENGSASIMESIAYMILCLPNNLGGYNLGGAAFNQEINLDCNGATRLGQQRCFADLFYQSHKIAVEYDSFAFHSSPMAQGKDAIRSSILERQGISVMKLSTIQLYNNEACLDFALNLASRLGKRIQIRTKKFNPMHGRLRKLLPTGNENNANSD